MNKALRLLTIFFAMGTCLFGQELHHWTIDLKVPFSTPKEATVYIAGDFNAWAPGDSAYRLTRVKSGRYEILLDIESKAAEYKFTLGTWSTVELKANGDEQDNRIVVFDQKDQETACRVYKWGTQNRYMSKVTGDVRIMKHIDMPQLGRSRTIRVYLPPGYDKDTKRYPVLYMHDGQNLFADSSSFSGEWGVDETLEKMISRKQIKKMIVVGIDNDPEHRLNEYSPDAFDYQAVTFYPQANEYAAFLVETLKPYIDSTFRTKPSREFTAVAGSSMGGLVSVYIGVKYQDVFSKVGAMSSSFGVCRDYMIDYIAQHPKRYPMRFWLDMGSEEIGHMDMNDYQLPVQQALVNAGWIKGKEVTFHVFKGAKHNEKYWRSRFHKVVKFLFR